MLTWIDVLYVSKIYVRKKLQYPDAASFLQWLNEQIPASSVKPTSIVCPWGEAGVFYLDRRMHQISHITTAPLTEVVDSVGAGDTFIGASIAGLMHWQPPMEAFASACRIATHKCTQQGFGLPPDVLAQCKAQFQEYQLAQGA